MNLISDSNKINLKNIIFVNDVYVSCIRNKFVIHLTCDKGNEQHVSNGLPNWIRINYNVVKSVGHIFITTKE